MKNKWLLLFLLLIVAAVGTLSFLLVKKTKEKIVLNYEQAIQDHIKKTKWVKNQVWQKLPIYEDYKTKKIENDLRKFLLNDHLRVVKEAGAEPIQSDEELSEYVENKTLISVSEQENKPYFFYNVPKKYRALTPATLKGLEELSEKLQAVIRKKIPNMPLVKYAISSALRPVAYQKKLRYKNANASEISSHSYGMSVDIFYDSFYIDIKSTMKNARAIESEKMSRLALQTGFLLGDANRRQLKSMLTEAILQMQKEGKLYAILERNQRCYHITILQSLYALD